MKLEYVMVEIEIKSLIKERENKCWMQIRITICIQLTFSESFSQPVRRVVVIAYMILKCLKPEHIFKSMRFHIFKIKYKEGEAPYR